MIQISYKDPRPIHAQVEEGVRRLIVSQVLGPGSQLPSVRDLASTLAINPNTIARAYRDLEAQGYIYKVAGRGSFVCDELPGSAKRREELLRTFDQTTMELLFLSMSARELSERINTVEHTMRKEGHDE